MESVFLHLLNMSITAGWLVLAVMVLRLLMKRAPRWMVCLLWVLVAVRLICPVSVESVLSLIPSTETVPTDVVMGSTPTINSGVPVVDAVVNPIISDTLAPTPEYSADPVQIATFVAANVWVIGMVAMLLYALISTLRLRWQVRESACLRRNIRQCDRVATPFILGIIRPRIYLPSTLPAQDALSVVAHEEAHIQRRDHWWKPLGYLLLTVYWFNPLLWVGYILLCRDIEAACDERVIRDMDMEQRRRYSEALLACSMSRRMISACPLAFGETGVKSRIKSVLSYKKPTFWIVLLAVVLTIVAAVCLLTNPKEKPDEDDVSTDTPVTDTQTEEQFTREFYHEFVANSYNWLSEDKLQELISDAAYAEDALPLLVLNNPAEVEAFIEKYDEDMGLTRNDSTGVNVAAQMREAYTQDFFDRNIVLAVYYKDGSCSVEPRIVGAKYTEGGDSMQLMVEVYEPYMQDEALGQWFMLFGIKRSVTESITDFTAAVRGHVPTDHYAAAFARAVKAPADGKELWRTWFSDEEEVYLRSMMKRLNWETKDLKGKKSFFIGAFNLYGQTCYVGSRYDILVSGDRMTYLTEADGTFLRKMLQSREGVTTVPPYGQAQIGDFTADAPEERSYFTGKMIEWSKAKGYFLLEVTRADAAELVGKKVKVSTARLEAGGVPVIGSSVDVEYDGMVEAGDPPMVYALDLAKTDSDQLGGPDDDDSDGRFTGKVIEVADGKMLMECYDKAKFDTVWVALALCPDLNPKVGEEYTVYHADLVMETDPPEVTADHVVALSSTPTSSSTTTSTTVSTTMTTTTTTTTTKSTVVSTTTTTSTTAPKKTTTKPTTTKTTAVSTTTKSTTTTKPTEISENLPKVSENTGVYRVDRELFQQFLNAPSFKIIKDCGQSRVVNMGAVFFVGEHTVFSIYQPLVDLVNDEEYLTSFLQKNGIREKVVGAVSLTSTGMPFTLWVQTEQRNVFITVELTGKFPREGDPYTFTVLSQEQYAEKYLWREATLLVNDVVVSTDRFAPALVCESRALIPFKRILEACGANRVINFFGQEGSYEVDGREYIIYWDDYDDTFRINEMHENWEEEPWNGVLLSRLESENAPNTTIRYVVFDEIIVDNIYLETLLEYMFKDAQISVEYSFEKNTIEISVK